MSPLERVQWVDTAKGLGIVLVVFMHATFGVEKALGAGTYLHGWVMFAQPFRMPDFFVISGLFLHRSADWPVARFVDRKILHFLYFYLLWYAIQAGSKFAWQPSAKAPDFARFMLSGLVDPFGTLWFIYVLALCMAALRLARPLPKPVLLAAAVLLHLAQVQTGWVAVDEFCARFVYVVIGQLGGPWIVATAKRLGSASTPLLLGVLAVWAVLNAMAVGAGIDGSPAMSLLLGVSGAGAVIVASLVLARSSSGNVLAALGQRSLPVYLSFFAPMAIVRVAGISLGGSAVPTVLALASTAAGVLAPLLLFRACKRGPLRFLFARPRWAKLSVPGSVSRTGGEVPEPVSGR